MSGFSDDDLALEIQAKNKYLKDDLINALQIEREINKNTFQNVSEDLAHSFIQNISQKMRVIKLKEIFPIKSLR